MKIDFLIGDNPYNTVRYFSKKLGSALQRIGVKVRYFDISGGKFYQAFYAILDDRPDLTCSFTDVTIGDKEPLGNAWQIPHLSLLVDHCIYFLHQMKGNFSLISTMDEEDHLFLKQIGFKKSFFFPHAACSRTHFPEQEKIYDVVFFGTLCDVDAIENEWKSKYSHEIYTILMEAATSVLKGSFSCLEVLLKNGFPLHFLAQLHQELESYVNGKARLQLLKQIGDVHIWGRGKWKKYLPYARINKPVSFSKALKIMAQSKIVINSALSIKYGYHERLFHSFLTGALPLTPKNHFTQQTFSHRNNILYYRFDEWEEVKENISYALENQGFRNALVNSGKKIVMENHTWNHRASELLTALQSGILEI